MEKTEKNPFMPFKGDAKTTGENFIGNSQKPVAEDKLPEEVAKKYKAVGVVPGNVIFNGVHHVDMRKLTLKEAGQLVEAGFPYLALIDDKKEEPKKIS